MLAESNRILPSKKVNAGTHSQETRGPDLYPSPPPLTQALLDCGEEIPNRLWEAAAGRGDMARVLQAAGHEIHSSDAYDYGWSGLTERKDFFSYQEAPEGFDTICTNPPFSLSANFVRHGLRLCKKVIILNRLAFLEGKNRADILDRHLTRAYVFVNRAPGMHRWSLVDGEWIEWQGKKSPSAMPVCWLIFEREVKDDPKFEVRRISWRKLGT